MHSFISGDQKQQVTVENRSKILEFLKDRHEDDYIRINEIEFELPLKIPSIIDDIK